MALFDRAILAIILIFPLTISLVCTGKHVEIFSFCALIVWAEYNVFVWDDYSCILRYL